MTFRQMTLTLMLLAAFACNNPEGAAGKVVKPEVQVDQSGFIKTRQLTAHPIPSAQGAGKPRKSKSSGRSQYMLSKKFAHHYEMESSCDVIHFIIFSKGLEMKASYRYEPPQLTAINNIPCTVLENFQGIYVFNSKRLIKLNLTAREFSGLTNEFAELKMTGDWREGRFYQQFVCPHFAD